MYDSTMFVLGGLILSALLSDWLKELLAETGCKKFTEEGIPVDILKAISELF